MTAVSSSSLTLTSSPSSLPYPGRDEESSSFLERINRAAKKLDHALKHVPSATQVAAHQQLLQGCAKSVLQTKDKVLDLTKETGYDVKKFNKILGRIFLHYQNASKTSSLSDSKTSSEVQAAIDFLNKVEQELKALIEKVKDQNTKALDSYKFRMGSVPGICWGFCLAMMQEGNDHPQIKSPEKRSLERERLGRFYHLSSDLQENAEQSHSPQGIGEYILKHPQRYQKVLAQIARVLGYDASKEKDFLLDLEKNDAPLLTIKRFIGKFVLKQIPELYEESQQQLQLIDQGRQKKEEHHEKIEENKRKIANLEKEEKNFQEELQPIEKKLKLLNELAQKSSSAEELAKGILDNIRKFHSILDQILHAFNYHEVDFFQLLPFIDSEQESKIIAFIVPLINPEIERLSKQQKAIMGKYQELLTEKLKLLQENQDLKIKLLALDNKERELLEHFQVLTKEHQLLLPLADKAPKSTYDGLIPPLIKQRKKITETGEPSKLLPLSMIETSLIKLAENEENRMFTLYDQTGKAIHAIYIDFKTLVFCDINDQCYLTLFAKERMFLDHEELIEEFSSFLEETYKGKYPLFALWHYELDKSPSSTDTAFDKKDPFHA